MIKRVVTSVQMLSVALLLFFPIKSHAAECGPLRDGSFEEGTPNPYWAETSTNVDTPLCDAELCGEPNSARTGNWWAWFGGVDTAESGSVTQNIVVPTDSLPRLNFYLQNPLTSVAGNGVDFLKVTIDGQPVFNMLAGNPLYASGYTLVDLDLAPYADGNCHSLSFESTTNGVTNIFVDDVAIVSCSATVKIGTTTYGSVQTAMNAAGNDSEISATAHSFNENLLFSQSGRVTFKGGYDCAFARNVGNTTIGGDVTIGGAGTLEMANVIIR